MSGITGFFVAVGIASAIFFILMIRSDRTRDRRRAYADSSTSDTTGDFSLLTWFSGNSSSSSSDDSCTSSSFSFSSSDSSCASDGGGSGDGGGGGGD